jgi:hypothetical protein
MIQHKYEHDVHNASLPKTMKNELRDLFCRNLTKEKSNSRKGGKCISFKTQELRVLNILASLEELHKIGGFDIQSVYSLKEKHIEFLVQHWSKTKSTGTIANKVTYLSTLAHWMNKSNIVKPMKEYAAANALEKRTGIAKVDQSWDSKGISAEKVIANIAAEDPFVAIQLLLQRTYGLRKLESMMLRPHDAFESRGGVNYLHIYLGAKNGKYRKILHVDADLAVLELAKRLVNSTSGSTIPDDYSLEEWGNHYKYLMQKYGITKNQLGITSHGLRKQKLNEIYEEVTGEDSPVRGGDMPNRELFNEARQIISSYAGHSRLNISNAYIGNHSTVQKRIKKEITREMVFAMLEETNGNKQKAAEKLGCARSHLYNLLKESIESK